VGLGLAWCGLAWQGVAGMARHGEISDTCIKGNNPILATDSGFFVPIVNQKS
jgi:hypothetical protein